MLVGQITSEIQSIQNREIEQKTHKIGFIVTGDMAGSWATTAPQTALEALLGNTSFELAKQGRDGTKTFINTFRLSDLAQICTATEGHIRMHTISGTNRRVIFTVDISNYGAVELSYGEKLLFSVRDVDGDVDTIDIYAISNPILTQVMNKYERVRIRAASETQLNCAEYDLLAIPRAYISKVSMKHSNGQQVEYTKEELELINNDMGHCVARMEGTIVNPAEMTFILLGTAGFQYVNVTLTTESDVYQVKEKAYADVDA